jgi:hypothetical protein
LRQSIVQRNMPGWGSAMRICIYKTDRAPDLTLLLREGLPLALVHGSLAVVL